MKEIKLNRPISVLALTVIIITASCVHHGIKFDTSPDELSQKMINNPDFIKYPNGEDFCWRARVGMDQFVNFFKLSGDTRWLDAEIRYYDFLIGKLVTDPDGYKGWIGVYGYDEKFLMDALVGDAILFDGILNFSTLVAEDNSLRNKYMDKANSYVEIAIKDFFEKWD